MNSTYSQSVLDVPKDFNQPTSNYKKHVYIAVAGILAFFGTYLFLTYWFFNSAYRLLMDAVYGSEANVLHFGLGIASLFLGIFMIKAFFFVQTKYDVQDREIKQEEEPILFDFLYKLADETGAPRPNKVYLSNRVNASVFYDLSFLNLFFPSKKNLEIGLGLINVLNLGEFKAVLAHEYGHFAQRSMLVGRWVYIANQIATTIITKRDALDSLLVGLSSIDIRIAWIGWILSLIVWSIRSLVELIFRLVILSQRALSREMEFQADLVAVSVTGSDALIHALHKLQAADAALSNAMQFVENQLEKKKAIEDLYALQSNAIEKTAYILNDESYGKSPVVPSSAPETFRVFSNKIAQPPQMWSTHPPDQEREENAKKRYIKSDIDNRDAWDLFKNPKQTRILLTEDLIKTAKIQTEIMGNSEAIQIHDKQFDKSFFNPKYKGIYLSRFIYEDFNDSEEIYHVDITEEEFSATLKDIYPASLVEDIEDFTTLKEELAQLEALRDKKLQATGDGGIYHRGTPIRKAELPRVISSVSKELKDAKKIISTQDQKARTVHLRLAEKIGHNWPAYLKSLGKVIHYCEHNLNDLLDAHNVLNTVLVIVMADNSVSKLEMLKLIDACNDLHKVMENVDRHRNTIRLDERLLKELGSSSWAESLPEFKLSKANDSHLNRWLDAVDDWISTYHAALNNLRSEALEVLLKTEDEVLTMSQSNQIHQAPIPTKIDVDYNRFLPGSERPIEVKLGIWDKFISADGIVPSITKFAVAASIVGATVFFTGSTGQSDVSIYNGLAQVVSININGEQVVVHPRGYKKINIPSSGSLKIKSSLEKDGTLIDELINPTLNNRSSHYIYNVAGAAVLFEYEIYYGDRNLNRNLKEVISAKKWMQTNADFILKTPPDHITTSSSNGETLLAVEAAKDYAPGNLVSLLENEQEQIGLIQSHVLYDPNDEYTLYWTNLATQLNNAEELLTARLSRQPDEVETLRALMELASDESRVELCQEYTEKSTKNPENPDFKYIACRCLDDQIKSTCFQEAATKWPKHTWNNYAAGYSYISNNEWELAYLAYQRAYQNNSGLKAPLATYLERIGRWLKHKKSKYAPEVHLHNQYLEYCRMIEERLDEDPSFLAYHFLYKGELEQARTTAKVNPGLEKEIHILTAASDGAKEEWITNALKLDNEQLSETALFTLTGLYLKKGKSLDNLQEQLTIFDDDSFNMNHFISLLKNRSYKEASKMIKNNSVEMKGQLALIAYIAYGNSIPTEWKNYVKFLLFAPEKPFFK